MKYINKYTNKAAYDADAGRVALTRSSVSLIEDGTGIKVDGYNVLTSKETAEIGDIVVYEKATATKRILKAGTYKASSLPANILIVGVVYSRVGNLVRVVSKANSATSRYAAGYQRKLSGFSVSGGSFTITVNAITTASITYVYADTSSLAQIATNITAAFTTAGIANWTITADVANNCIIAEYNYYTSISAFSVTDANSNVVTTALNSQFQTTLVGGSIIPYGSITRNGGVSTYFGGANFDRFKVYYSASGDDAVNKDSTYTGVIKESRFNATDNPVLYALYANYDAYLQAQCVRFPFLKGAITDKLGKSNTAALAAITWNNASSVATPAYPAASAANSYAIADTVGFLAGDWWLPSCRELFLLMRDVALVNASLSAIGASQVPVTSSFWSSTECSAASSWLYGSSGTLGYNYKSNIDNVRAVTAF